MWTDGWTDSHQEPNTRSSEMFEVPDIIHFLFTRYGLTFVRIGGAVLENSVTVVVNCYDVGSPTPDCCKSDISDCYYVEKLIRILILELHFVRLGEIGNY